MDARFTVADLPESGRWVVVDETSGRWVWEGTDADAAERAAKRLNKDDVERNGAWGAERPGFDGFVRPND